MESEMEQRQYDECKSCLKNIDTIDRLTAQLAEWHNVFGHLSKDADTAGNMIYEGIAERNAEIERLKLIEVVYRAIINNTHIAEDERLAKIIELTEQLAASQQQVAELQQEVERLKTFRWIQTESYEAVAAVEDARKQAAREALQFIDPVTAIHAIHAKRYFGLEGEG